LSSIHLWLGAGNLRTLHPAAMIASTFCNSELDDVRLTRVKELFISLPKRNRSKL